MLANVSGRSMVKIREKTAVVVIGAGPYGLSLAAQLRARRVPYRIFGEAMRFWRDMPIGVNLKSLAFATNIYVPQRGSDFPAWCREHSLEDYEPCTMQSFAAYGLDMQRRFVPDLEEVLATNVRLTNGGFETTLSSGELVASRKVVVCTGLSGLAHVPETLTNLDADRMKHTFNISNYSEFRNKRVAVIGAGASAIEAGALVLEAGGTAEVFIRNHEPVFHGRSPRVRPLFDRIKQPMSVLGASRRGWLLEKFPLLVHRLPLDRRTRLAKQSYGPASPWWITDRVKGKVPIHARHELTSSQASATGVQLNFRNGDGRSKSVDFDFVIAGTGYEANVSRLKFIDAELANRISRTEGAPTLNGNFESSVPGLFFAGPISFMCFGPLFRFVAGADVASKRLARHLDH